MWLQNYDSNMQQHLSYENTEIKFKTFSNSYQYKRFQKNFDVNNL